MSLTAYRSRLRDLAHSKSPGKPRRRPAKAGAHSGKRTFSGRGEVEYQQAEIA
jgi:hypothetical protein